MEGARWEEGRLDRRQTRPGVLRPLATSRSSPLRTASTLRLLAPSPRAGSYLFRGEFPEALPPETRDTANARDVSARRQDLALRASARGPCDTRDGDAGRNRSSRLFPKAGRSRKHGSPRPPKEGVLRGAAAPSSTRLPLSGRLTTEKVRLTSGKQAGSSRDTTAPALAIPSFPFTRPRKGNPLRYPLPTGGSHSALWQGNSRCLPLPAGKTGAPPPAGRAAPTPTPAQG